MKKNTSWPLAGRALRVPTQFRRTSVAAVDSNSRFRANPGSNGDKFIRESYGPGDGRTDRLHGWRRRVGGREVWRTRSLDATYQSIQTDGASLYLQYVPLGFLYAFLLDRNSAHVSDFQA